MPPATLPKILIVDDRQENLMAAEAVLEGLEAEIVKASSGLEALWLLLKHDFALILLDVQMPGMDGFETCEILRQRERTRWIPVIFLTAIGKSDEQILRGYQAGAIDYLVKPLHPLVLRAKVALYLDLDRKEKEIFALLKQLKRQNAELMEAKAMADDATRAKSDFLANMSHELRTPLNSIIGFSELMAEGISGELTDKQRENLGYIISSGRHLLRLINDILDLSKVEAGKMVPEFTLFRLSVALADSLVLFKEKSFKHQLSMELVIKPEADLEIEADERRLKQIVFNLLSNAVKFTPDGGRVTLTARLVTDCLAAKKLPFTPAEEGQEGRETPSPTADQRKKKGKKARPEGEMASAAVEISVADTGIGIKPQDLDRLFKEFSQLETAYNKQHEGTGLGLALTKKLVELHGGRIWATSTFGQGSVFSFVLPVRQKRKAEDGRPQG